MNFTKKLLASSVAASVIAAGSFVSSAHAEISASVGVANMYYWRGVDLGDGDAAVSGDISYSNSGFYTGLWGSSGDAGAGTEYDIYLGYGASFGAEDMFSIDVSLWNYNYPSKEEAAIDIEEGQGILSYADVSPDIGDLVEAVVSVGYGPVALTYYHGLQDLEDYWYTTLSATFGQFSINGGMHEDDMMHIDLSYAYNDNLAFTLGQVVDDADGEYDDDLKFVVSYSLPIGE